VGPVCVLGEACQAGGSCGVLAVIARSFSVPACHAVDSGKTGSIDAAMQWERPVDIYPWLKTLHVFLAIVAVGFNVSYAIWQARAAREPDHMGWALRGIKFLDDRIANPSYIGLAIVGVALVLLGPWEFTDFWVYASIALYVVLAVVGLGLYSPVLKRQIASYEASGAATAEFTALSARSRLLGMVLAVTVLLIIVLMVVKPGA
jgi:uncharacterized membrane protein